MIAVCARCVPVLLNYPVIFADVVELWAFLGRFADLIGLERVPSIAELEADLTAPNGSRNITTSALVCFHFPGFGSQNAV